MSCALSFAHCLMLLLELVLLLMICAVALGWLARHFKFPYPIALVAGGALLGMIPNLPQFPFDPQLILVVVLPPILYQAALLTSWSDFKTHIRSISLLAIGLVIVTTLAVGITLKLMVPKAPSTSSQNGPSRSGSRGSICRSGASGGCITRTAKSGEPKRSLPTTVYRGRSTMVNLDASESLDHSTATTPETGVKVSASDRRVRDEGPRLLGSVWHHLGTVGVDMAFFVAAWKSCRCVVASCKFVGGDSASYHSVDVRNIERIGVRWKPYQLAFKKDHSMKEYPILFSGPMVRAILEGRKTQTRRVVKPQPVGNQRIVEGAAHLTVGMNPADDGGVWYATDCVNPGTEIRCPYGVPGDRLWVRETFGYEWKRDSVGGTGTRRIYCNLFVGF